MKAIYIYVALLIGGLITFAIIVLNPFQTQMSDQAVTAVAAQCYTSMSAGEVNNFENIIKFWPAFVIIFAFLAFGVTIYRIAKR
jgi:hypothetical protein